MGATSIQWTDWSVNPIRARVRGRRELTVTGRELTGHYCEKVSPGCASCYSSELQKRFRMPSFAEQRRADIEHFLDASQLEQVLRRRKATKIFWCDMCDMFGDWVPNEWIAACFGVMAATPQHVHQILTKRAKRMREWFEWAASQVGPLGYVEPPDLTCQRHAYKLLGERFPLHAIKGTFKSRPWPLTWVWLGVSAEDQQRADERIPDLLETPAAIRFVSVEPQMGFVSIRKWMHDSTCLEFSSGGCICSEPREVHLDWVIQGGESGRNARPFDVAWARSLRDECREAGVAYFLKQLGANIVDVHPDQAGAVEEAIMRTLKLRDSHGGDWDEWPLDLRVREFPRGA